jgi:hypothetical protein
VPTFSSPNGLYTLSIEDTGITMTGPDSALFMGPSSVGILAGPVFSGTGSVVVVTQSAVALGGGDMVSMEGPRVVLNNGGLPIARQGDLITDSNGGFGAIISGNPSVDA